MAIAAVMLGTGCRTPTGSPPAGRPLARDAVAASDVRQLAVFLRIEIDRRFGPRETDTLAGEYEGALLDALNARAMPTADVTRLTPGAPTDAVAIVARAREVGADHALVVDVRVERSQASVCAGTRHPFTTDVMVWRQSAQVIRAADGLRRADVSRPGVDVPDLDPDCDDPKASARPSSAAAAARAADRLLWRVFSGS